MVLLVRKMTYDLVHLVGKGICWVYEVYEMAV